MARKNNSAGLLTEERILAHFSEKMGVAGGAGGGV